VINDLLTAGVKWPDVEIKTEQPLQGKIFVITGTLESMKRETIIPASDGHIPHPEL